MKVPCFRLQTSPRRVFIGASGLCLIGLLAGCTPKRVVNGRTEPAPAPPSEKSRPTEDNPADFNEFGLPKPNSRGKSGGAVTGAKPAEVTFGLQVATLAREQLGKPYQWGGYGPDRFDCSGLVFFIMGNLGVNMPRVSQEQSRYGQEVKRSQLAPGDLVFFATSGRRVDHVGIYVGDSKFIHAPRQHVPVRTDSLDNFYWSQRLQTVRRIRG